MDADLVGAPGAAAATLTDPFCRMFVQNNGVMSGKFVALKVPLVTPPTANNLNVCPLTSAPLPLVLQVNVPPYCRLLETTSRLLVASPASSVIVVVPNKTAELV